MTSLKEKSDISNGRRHSSTATIINKGPLIGYRHVQTLLMFLLLAIAYSMRVNLSMGIIAMTDRSSTKNPDIKAYDWSETEQSWVKSSFFIGYICLQVFAGELGKKYGPKWFLVVAMAINAGGSIITPFVASTRPYGLIAVRIIQGLFQGFFFPSVHNILGKWAPVDERSTLGNVIFTGVAFGTIFALIITGVISASWAGWPAAFYLFGGLGVGWCVLWSVFGSNSPAEHKFISKEEQFYIESSLGNIERKEPPATPWKEILTSLPVWAIVVANFGQNWGYSVLLTEIPNYLKNIAGEDIAQGSWMSALPYAVLFLLGLIFGPIADMLVNKNILSAGNTRKLMNSIGAIIPAIALTVLGFMPSDQVYAIETLLVIAVGINAAIWCGYQVNHVDLSPRFSGILMGIGNGSSNIFSIISPLIKGYIVTDPKSESQWRIVFLVAAGWYVSSNIFYVIFAKAEKQWWDALGDKNDSSSDVTIVVHDNKEEKKS